VPVLHRTGNVRSASDRHPLIVRRALVSSSPPSQPPSPAPSPSALEPAAITNVTPSETWFDHWADRAGPETPFLSPSHDGLCPASDLSLIAMAAARDNRNPANVLSSVRFLWRHPLSAESRCGQFRSQQKQPGITAAAHSSSKSCSRHPRLP
jgi:hypothetical protein